MRFTVSSWYSMVAPSWFGSQLVIGVPPVATGCLVCLMMYALVISQWMSRNMRTKLSVLSSPREACGDE